MIDESVPAKTKLHRRFCDAVRAHRIASGLTQAAVAARLGVTAPTYNAIESGKASPTLDQVERVARALGCDPSELLIEKVLS
jgi:transcriptional regulator with XRE-family HTH domain